MLTEANVTSSCVIHLTFAHLFKEALWVDKLNEMSTIRVPVKIVRYWIVLRGTITIAFAIHPPPSEAAILSRPNEKYIEWCFTYEMKATVWMLGFSIPFEVYATFFLLYLSNQTLLFHFLAYFDDSTNSFFSLLCFVWCVVMRNDGNDDRILNKVCSLK